MVNYYKQLKQLNLQGKQIPLEEFKQLLRSTFGFGTHKTISRWLDNFIDNNMIRLTKNESDIWVVEIL